MCLGQGLFQMQFPNLQSSLTVLIITCSQLDVPMISTCACYGKVHFQPDNSTDPAELEVKRREVAGWGK